MNSEFADRPLKRLNLEDCEMFDATQAECDRMNALLFEENTRLAQLQEAWERKVWDDIQSARLGLSRWRGAVEIYEWTFQSGEDIEIAYSLTDTPDGDGFIEFFSFLYGDRLMKVNELNSPAVKKRTIHQVTDLPRFHLYQKICYTAQHYYCYKAERYYVDRSVGGSAFRSVGVSVLRSQISSDRFCLPKPEISDIYPKEFWTECWRDYLGDVGYKIHPKLLK